MSLEYVMIDGLNDGLPAAERLAHQAAGWAEADIGDSEDRRVGVGVLTAARFLSRSRRRR